MRRRHLVPQSLPSLVIRRSPTLRPHHPPRPAARSRVSAGGSPSSCYPSRVMIHITEISKSFGTQVILDQASLHIRPGMRIGLVGPNGAGKTTLLRILAQEMSLDDGDINARKGLRIGFLPQEIEEIAEFAVLDEVLASYADILDMEHRLKGLGERISAAYEGDSSEDADALMNELGSLQTAFEHAEGYELESRAQSILSLIHISEPTRRTPI